MKIFAIICGILLLCAGLLFGIASWLLHVPPVEVAGGNPQMSLKNWLDDRHNGTASQFNGAALIIDDGRVLIRKTWGKDGNNRSLSPSSQFRLASVSKSFTAAAILRLADTGRIDLDRPVGDQFEDCPVAATPAQLLRHRSGLPDNYMEVADPEQTLTIATAVKGICGSGDKANNPGEFSYNNTGYVLLAGLVEKVSGTSFESFMAKEIFVPLGLSNTRVWNLVSKDQFPERAVSFNRNGPLNPTYLDGVAGDGAVFSTLDDLRNWAQFWQDDRLISQKLKDRATGRKLEDGYHFGLVREGNRVWHNGSWLGAATYFGFEDGAKDENLVILLDNGSSMVIDDMQAKIWTALQ